jgi:hypothetical protein
MPKIKVKSELWQKPPDPSFLFLHLWVHYSMDHSFKKAAFYARKKGSQTLV